MLPLSAAFDAQIMRIKWQLASAQPVQRPAVPTVAVVPAPRPHRVTAPRPVLHDAMHGTVQAYVQLNCRCRACCAANKSRRREVVRHGMRHYFLSHQEPWVSAR